MDFLKEINGISVEGAILEHVKFTESMAIHARMNLLELKLFAGSSKYKKHIDTLTKIVLKHSAHTDLNLLYAENETLLPRDKLLYKKAIKKLIAGPVPAHVALYQKPDGITDELLLLAGEKYCREIFDEFKLLIETKDIASSEGERNQLVNKLPEILRMSRYLFDLDNFFSRIFDDMPKRMKESIRISNSRMKIKDIKRSQWEDIERTICCNLSTIYSPGNSLHSVTKKIAQVMSKNYQNTPDPQTIKRHLKEFANITGKNIDQISHLINNRHI